MEKRYTVRALGRAINVSYQTVLNRAKALGIECGRNGLTLEQCKAIKDLPCLVRDHNELIADLAKIES